MVELLPACSFGAGLLLVWTACTSPAPTLSARTLRTHRSYLRVKEDLALAGLRTIKVRYVVGWCLASALVAAAFIYVWFHVPAISVLGGVAGLSGPWLWVRQRAQATRRARRDAWPDAVDHVASAVRAGLSIPEALRQLANHGPEALREDFRAFSQHEAAHGRFDVSLDVLKSGLADPAADRLIESLRLARNVGGTDVGRLLRTLSNFLREDAATRAELIARQSWTVSAARLALAAPWIALVIVGARGGGFEAYRSAAGVAVLVGGGAISIVAYAAMRAIGRLPLEERVMR